ncbi:unnamed protein product [Didymodactylos carnosus]|uniref:Uncharacterized protein n=1 Tax=Didymodactylos carnosus TaxID=1234261 RepID=A0A815TMF0_9BILA|nr:unnamed protein product [Didymodactylos carnosus]CAF1508435.1 unnamed protein product [Didymodactylos carnosus]CAF3997318.1 unnamed protein product [Didymodactylos carnosus]CAF4369385.1 unnamed protein product [Didymodactylos carnosus]
MVRQRLADGKFYGGSGGRMADKMITHLSESYGMAIRQGSRLAKDMEEETAVQLMKKKCMTAFCHNINDQNKSIQHKYCPTTPDTWCSFHKSKYTNQPESGDKVKQRLDPVFRDVLSKIIEDLTDPELLRRSLRGLTQNSNESLNSMIWSILSKSKNHGFISVRGTAAEAVIIFNRGRVGLLPFFDTLGLDVNYSLLNSSLAKDSKRLAKAESVVAKRETVIEQKKQACSKSLTVERDISEYGAGAH